MYLVLMVTNCSSECSISKMNVIKNRLRTTTTNERQNNHALMSIESEILREMDFDEFIAGFAKYKARKVPGFVA